MLSTVDEEEQKVLNQGLLDWQKKRSTLGGKDLVAWMLNNTKFDEDELSKSGRMAELSSYVQKTMKHELYDDSIIDTFHCDDAHSIRLPLDDVPSNRSRKNTFLHPVTPLVSCNLSLTGVDELFNLSDDSDHEPESRPKVNNMIEPLMEAPEPDSASEFEPDSYSETHSQLQKQISIKKFTAIMKKAPKQYDIDAIVADLQDPTGQYIEMRNIGSYHKRCNTIGQNI